MKAGDLVQTKEMNGNGEIGLFLGLSTGFYYEYAEVMWASWTTPSGTNITLIQSDLLEVISIASHNSNDYPKRVSL